MAINKEYYNEDIKIGITTEELINKIQNKTSELYDNVDALDSEIADLAEDVEDIRDIAQGKVKSVVYASIDALLSTTGLQSLTNTALKIGDTIFIEATDVPDFWVSNIISPAVTGSYVITETDWAKNGYSTTQIGYYSVSKLETQKVDLAEVSTNTEEIEKIKNGTTTVGQANKDAQGNIINETYVNYTTYSGNNAYVNSQISALQTGKVAVEAGKGLSTNDFTTEHKNKLDAIDDSLKNVTADQIGKVKDVTVNGRSVLNNSGVAVIDIATLAWDTDVSLTANKDITINGTKYFGFSIAKTKVYFEVYNSNKQEVVTQKVVDATDGSMFIACSTIKDEIFYLRKISGNGVGGGSGKYMHYVNLELTDAESNTAWCAFSYVSSRQSLQYDVSLLESDLLAILGDRSAFIPATGVVAETSGFKQIYGIHCDGNGDYILKLVNESNILTGRYFNHADIIDCLVTPL